ncbi:DNA-3-methyladenine glycosylase I [Actibacterium lipolyticum]|uniref:DNA-3-methyladenine glycosylase 1 n=1 Tax=Actibacterium lipolyticum TaxID=1524263 RepID=A0A238JM31_9RHOB|nr:DNA-3-methyladenine glycosylase I [Actibacterium lipolyticum]SMX31545.1 DNA-3-methyladenine glycosylase 1 [Actibacterium lipolyticum]
MRSFDEIFHIAAERKGGADAVEATLSHPKSHDELAQITDDRWLAAMARGIFQAGFSWKVIENKWPGFEAAFAGFDPARVAFFHDEDLDRLLSDTGIVRNGKKIRAVMDNAGFVQELAAEHGSAAKFFAEWPDDDFVGLLALIKARGSHLGGTTGQYLFRSMGKDSFILSKDVVVRLIAEGVVDKTPTSKKALSAVQGAFNDWKAQSGRSMTEISRTLALSV